MKKLLTAIIFLCLGTAAMAQDEPQAKFSVATNNFFSNWYAEAGVNWSAFYSSQEHGNGLKTSPFKGFRSTPSISLAFGKWFTPGIGLRTKFTGVWGRTVVTGNTSDNKSKSLDIQEQLTLNLTNLFKGYNDKRLWNLAWFGGAGLERNMSYNRYGLAISTGINTSLKINEKTRLYAELGIIMAEPISDGVPGAMLYNDNKSHSLWNNHDNRLYLELGVSYNLTRKTWKKAIDPESMKMLHQAEIDALKAQLNDANAERQRLEKQLSGNKEDAFDPTVGEDIPEETVE